MIYNLEFSCRARCPGQTTPPSLNAGKFLWERIRVRIVNITLLASLKGFNFNCGEKKKQQTNKINYSFSTTAVTANDYYLFD